MHRGRLFIALALALGGLGLFTYLKGTEAVAVSPPAGDIIRLHVVARSDSQEDQRVKLVVRDALLGAFSERWRAGSVDQVRRTMKDSLDEVKRVAQNALAREGATTDVEVEFGLSDFPTRVYNGVIYPAGTYEALRVLIGGGGGRNWWCVMYPALCLTDADAVEAQQLAMPLEEAPKPQVQFESRLWTWLKSLFGQGGEVNAEQ